MSDCVLKNFNQLLVLQSNELDISLKKSLSLLPYQCFNLEKLCRFGGYIDQESFSLNILTIDKHFETFEVKLGLFFNEIIGGCNCSEEPFTEVNYLEAYYQINATGIYFLRES